MSVVIVASAHKNGNTAALVARLEKSHETEVIDLLDCKVFPYAYEKTLDDDFLPIIEKIITSRSVVFATPVYWYTMSGLLKNFFDRLTDLITKRKDLGRKLKGVSCRVIACGADLEVPSGFEVPFRLTAEYFEMKYEGLQYIQMTD